MRISSQILNKSGDFFVRTFKRTSMNIFCNFIYNDTILILRLPIMPRRMDRLPMPPLHLPLANTMHRQILSVLA